MTFDQLCQKHNCDKGKLPGGVGHDYGRHYESVLGPLRERPIQLLEIGVGDGKSIKVWLDYFKHPKARIYGVDNGSCHELDADPRYVFWRGDQTDAMFLHTLPEKQGWYDVVIDDGCHMSNGIIPTFEALWPFVVSGGYYFIEDLKTSYLSGYQVQGWPPPIFFIKQLLDDINAQTDYKPSPELVYHYPNGTDGSRGIEWLHYSEELCILKKK